MTEFVLRWFFTLLVSVPALARAEVVEVAASPLAIAQLDGYALGLAQGGNFSGVVLVAKNGEILLERAYGKKDALGEGENTVNTRFNLASAGKMFTAVAILKQIAAGRISLESKVGEVLKDYRNQEFATTVSVRHLLTHTAGAGDIDLFGTEHAKNRERVRTVADMVALHDERAPAFTPGSQQEYGNFGHVVLGRMVEVLSGQDFEAYLQAEIFTPLGMRETGFDECSKRAPDLAVGYVQLNGKPQLNCATLPRRGFPAGGQVSTASDLFKFTEALRTGTLLPSKLFAEAIQPQREFMGLGFFATEYGPGYPERNFRWGHAGSADGICTDVRSYPKTGETIIALANSDVPSCFEVTNFLHLQWELRNQQRANAKH